MAWNFRNCTAASEDRSVLGSASVWAMAPASVGIASLIISLCVTFGGASVAIISYPLKLVSLAIALDVCQLIRQAFSASDASRYSQRTPAVSEGLRFFR